MRRIAAIAVSCLLLLTMAVVLKFNFCHYLAPRTSGLMGALHQKDLDIVLVGSSHTRQSYDIAEFEKLTGQHAFAVAYNGLDFSTIAPLVDELFADARHRPRICVIEAYSRHLATVPKLQDARLFFDAPPRMKYNLLRSYVQQRPGMQGWVESFVLAANKNNDLILTYPLNGPLVERMSYKGGYLGKYVPGQTAEQFASLSLPPAQVRPLSVQLAALDHIVSLARASGVHLAFIETPLPEPVFRQPDVRALKQMMHRIATEKGLLYYDADETFPINDPSLFADSNHLSTAGRERFTAAVAEWLKQNFASATSLRAERH